MDEWQKYYSVKPIKKQVSKEEFVEFVNNFPRHLERDVCGIADPPAITFNDFQLAAYWPYSVVANTWVYEDDPSDYYYEPEEEREYYIVENVKEVFASRTGFKD